jgi:predicted nucleotidyltransferase
MDVGNAGMPKDQLQLVTDLLLQVLGDAVVGLYLHGSSVSGGLRPTSDLDLLAVTGRRTTGDERRALIERLLPVSGPADPSGQSRPVEVELVAVEDIRPWRYPPRLDFQFGDWHRAAFARGDWSPWDPSNPDLAVILAVVAQSGRPLLGPPLREVIGEVPWADVRQAMVDSIPDLRSYLAGDERNVVLTFVRIWVTMATGVFHPKDAAADWALPRLPVEHRAVLEYARDNYLAGDPEAWGDLLPRVGPFVDHVVREISALAATGAAPGKSDAR